MSVEPDDKLSTLVQSGSMTDDGNPQVRTEHQSLSLNRIAAYLSEPGDLYARLQSSIAGPAQNVTIRQGSYLAGDGPTQNRASYPA